ncbi:glycoside hydrolase family 2 protein [Massilia horti]|uniref:Glycoside hydrolase family 2 protein n=1 Tax=Massilia horti TaxID=2562153 RepID=A0A4Y9T8A9_9BURK|nr:glycoside hydrolase family 2 TIM barrel-domain containing protein [Massilia horti]TFW34037.1 glycoside hydrolase family 2 protein [Massilia horti]
MNTRFAIARRSLTQAAAGMLMLAATICAWAGPRSEIALDANWRFTLAEGSSAWSAPSFDDAAWEAVALPHTWNNFDGQDGGNDYHRGTGWYRTRFSLPATSAGQRVLVEFDAASKVAEVFVNGKPVGSHTGAFARFRFDITDAVHARGDNVLAVRVNNAPSQIVPISGDFTQFGGLYRKARLLLTAPVHIATLDYASSGVYLTTRKLDEQAAQVEARVKLASDAKTAFKGTLRVRLLDAQGKVVAAADQPASIGAGKNAELSLPLRVERPHAWNGTADPYLYRAAVELVSGGKTLDAVEVPFGLRTFELAPGAGFILNGRPLALHGVNRHQDRPDKGWAIDEDDKLQDMAIMQEMGVNAIRLAHYQHDQEFYDLCDAKGMAVWAEFGLVNEAPLEAAAQDNAGEQLREMIRQNYNHPSIIVWGVGNETTGRNGDDAEQRAVALVTRLTALARAEDRSRAPVYASHHGLADPRNLLTDAIAFNKYFGWYSGAYADLGEFLDQFHAAHPQTPVGISEYGAGGSIYMHEDHPPVRVHQAKGAWHPEEWQTAYHEQAWLQIADRPWMWGTFVWNMFDFAADQRKEGDLYGRNDKGLVTYDRRTRKDAFYWYQANWTSKPMVHIVSKRFWERSQSQIEVKVYSNADEVELKVNGVSLGRKAPDHHRHVWAAVELQPGPNRVEAYAYRAGKVVAADWGGFTYRADGDPRPNRAVAELDAAAKAAAATAVKAP